MAGWEDISPPDCKIGCPGTGANPIPDLQPPDSVASSRTPNLRTNQLAPLSAMPATPILLWLYCPPAVHGSPVPAFRPALRFPTAGLSSLSLWPTAGIVSKHLTRKSLDLSCPSSNLTFTTSIYATVPFLISTSISLPSFTS
ncbi:hypothetical protein AGABI2DRAFT_119480 [Agaricus bisporus var. bisporus H97]|uniref:hypothetical protein n=1 Tax=Agaricus bisporus var. bisporus (strain H97 / ATCC MYA-4626 / FGSC 10389) TaxID=936046 RepID=UPI00029F4FEA|nr:hypothetical protein AGABI2DRAFT_119480 [Agaricus bisporus var. bisporus H97]EKV45809.1 hypothetical protein AGABI2DRAFT_119480 [Agaricus bisporus var. bisporus H97]